MSFCLQGAVTYPSETSPPPPPQSVAEEIEEDDWVCALRRAFLRIQRIMLREALVGYLGEKGFRISLELFGPGAAGKPPTASFALEVSAEGVRRIRENAKRRRA